MRWPKVVGTVLAGAAVLGCLVGSARAAAPLWEDFGKRAGEKAPTVAKSTRWGSGWKAEVGGTVGPGLGEYLRYPARGVFAKAGTVEIEAIRDNVPLQMEALLTLQDAQDHTVLAVQVNWDRPENREPMLEIATQESLWYDLVTTKGVGTQMTREFGMGKVGRGQKVHVAFSWGPKDGQCVMYVDGRPIEAKVADPGAFAETLAEAQWIVIGAQPRAAGAATSQSRSVITGFYVYDQVLDGAQLYANPEQFRPSAVTAPVVTGVSHDAGRVAGYSGKLVAGDVVTVTLAGAGGAAGSFDIAHYPDVGGKLTLDWRGWGVYLEEKAFFEEGEVNLREVEGYDVYVAGAPFDPAAPGIEPVARLKTQEQSYTQELLTVDVPYYAGVLARMRDGSRRAVIAPVANVALLESAPGVYTGSYKVGWADRYARAAVVGRLTSGELSTVVVAPEAIAIDPGLTLAVGSDPAELQADEKGTSQISVTVTNANGAAVSGHKVRFVLATTSQYTGVVGGGAFAEQVGGAISESRWGQTDLFGKVTATYVVGFAAKTAIITARDMVSNDTGATYVKSYIRAGAGLELEPVVETALMEAGYEVTVSTSDEWLTADGKSQARITARVTLNNEPVAGHQFAFSVTPGMGSVRAVKATTGEDGEARALYTAGTKIGVAQVTATDTTVDVSASVAIELRSDAPAKIAIKVDPEKLPADGRSRAELAVTVTDINDNPNADTQVEYRIVGGGGSLKEETGLTDRRGESSVSYQAGRAPGRVSFEITVRSIEPSAAELLKARELALAVADYNFY